MAITGSMAAAVPGASDLGLGLQQQVANESEDERRKRLLSQQQNRLMPNTAPGISSLGIGLAGYSAAGGIGGLGGR